MNRTDHCSSSRSNINTTTHLTISKSTSMDHFLLLHHKPPSLLLNKSQMPLPQRAADPLGTSLQPTTNILIPFTKDLQQKENNEFSNNNIKCSNPSNATYQTHDDANNRELMEERDDDWFQICCDGKTFTTTRATLLAEKDSMFSVMFQKNSPFQKFNRDLNHPMRPYVVFIDRNPQYFEPILNYLRSDGEILINPNVNICGVLLEAKYWGLSKLAEELERMIEQIQAEQEKIKRKDDSGCELTRSEIVKALLTCPTGKGGFLRFQGLNLTGIDLSGLDLSAINFSRTILRNANLSNCTLDYAEMRDTVLENCDFTNARMFKVVIKNANCKDVNFSGASFRGASITFCDLCGANFKSADLEMADLSNSNLKNADLSGASIKGVALKNCITTNVKHTSAMGGVIH